MLGAVDLSVNFFFFFFFCSTACESEMARRREGEIYRSSPLAWIHAEGSESEEYVGRKSGKLASCAADATRELTTHASYRTLLSDISSYISNTFAPLSASQQRESTRSNAIERDLRSAFTRKTCQRRCLTKPRRKEKGGLSIPDESQDTESTCSVWRVASR